MLVVDSKLKPLLVAAHLSTGVLLFATMLTIFLITYRLKALVKGLAYPTKTTANCEIDFTIPCMIKRHMNIKYF